jgi:hypothetical protein
MTIPMKLWPGLALLSLVGACAAPEQQPVIDLSQSASLVQSSLAPDKKPSVAAIEVADDALPPAKATRHGLSSNAPIKAQTAGTVRSDLQTYLERATIASSASTQKILAHVERAEAFWIDSAADNAPLVGLFRIGGDKTYVMLVRVSFEVEEAGKVERALTVEERYSITDGRAATQAQIDDSYRRLIAVYRQRFYAMLDTKFVVRYLR